MRHRLFESASVMRVGSMIILEGSDKGQSFDLPQGVVTIGRDQANSVPLSDLEVSQWHAELHINAEGFSVVDLGSASGVFVNQRKVEKQSLVAGDQVKIGGTIFVFSDQLSVLTVETSLPGAVAAVVESSSMLRKQERSTAVGEVMESLSHYIKNIFQSINGGTYLVESGLNGKDLELVEEGWLMVQRNQEYLSGLLMDMLAYSKPRTPKLTPGDLRKTIESAWRMLEKRAEHRQVAIDYQWLDESPVIALDSEMLQRAFQNIFLILIQTCLPGSEGRIQVAMKRGADGIVLTLANNQSRIEASDLETIFDPFSINETVNLVGISMAVAQKSIADHGGSIGVSQDEQSGVAFDVTLPIQVIS